MMEWFVVREGKTEGPYLDSQFHHLAEEGAIIPTDLVWYTGTERKESIPACEVHNFFAATPSPAWLADHIQSAAPKSTGDSQILSARRCSYLRRHWRGDLSLELTFWLNGAVFFFSLYTLPIVAPGMITARGNLVRTWIYFLGFLAALTVVSVGR